MCSMLLLCLLAVFAVLSPASGTLAQTQEIAPPALISGVRDASRAGTPLSEQPRQGAATQSLFDAASLLPIATIGSGSDIRPFLDPGVPQELTRAALHRAWASDPAIRDFVGLSENSWDFNAPDGISGFGPLKTDGAGRLAAGAAGNSVLNIPDKSATALDNLRR